MAYGAAQESNLPSVGLPRLTGFEDRLGHRAPPLRFEPSGARDGPDARDYPLYRPGLERRIIPLYSD